jgi:LysM repeat protein
MGRILFFLFILESLFVGSAILAIAESQSWKVRTGDNLDVIATTLEIPKEEIKKQNPQISETNLQVGQKLKLPLRSYVESKTLEQELRKKDARIVMLERNTSDLEKKVASAESQLRWQPIWLWGFWICFGIIAFIISAAYWIFRQTHPQVFEQPHERSIRDLRDSQIRVRSSFPDEEDGAGNHGRQWQPSWKRLSAHR